MSDRDPSWDALKTHAKQQFDARRQAAMAKATSNDDGGWQKHTPYHWSRTVAGKRLDYWPSRNKYQYGGKVLHGDVQTFIKRMEQKHDR